MTISNARSRLVSWARHNVLPPMRVHRSIAIGVALSLLVHGLLLLLAIPHPAGNAGAAIATVQAPFEVHLSQAAPPPPPSAQMQGLPSPPPPTPAAPLRDRTPKPRPPRRRNPVIAVPRPTPETPPVAMEEPAPPPPVATPEPHAAPPMDFMESILAKRRANEAAVARDNAQAQANGRDPSANDVAMANINQNLQTMSRRRDGVSGVFQILSKGIRTGEFSFRGWTTDERSNWREVYSVDAGLHGDIELAIVRKMIELIRTHYQGDFNWESRRLGRVIVLSARMEDNAELEAFLIREFFGLRP